MRGTPGREPHIPYQILSIPYQIWNSMFVLKEYVNRTGTAFHMPSYHGVYTVYERHAVNESR